LGEEIEGLKLDMDVVSEDIGVPKTAETAVNEENSQSSDEESDSSEIHSSSSEEDADARKARRQSFV